MSHRDRPKPSARRISSGGRGPASRPSVLNPALGSHPEVLLVYKKSKLALYAHERKNERFQALIERGDDMARRYTAAHEAHTYTLERVKQALSSAKVPFRTCYRARLAEKDTRGRLVVTVGGDGTLLDASHRITDAAVLGVNSDPERSVGFLCAARADTFGSILDAVLSGALGPTQVARLTGTVDGVPLRFSVLNEVLLAHRNPAATTRYRIRVGARSEMQKSSGIWLSAPAGSTAAIASAGGVVQALDDRRMQVRVREPYIADGDIPELLSFFVAPEGEVSITSRMREGVLYLDGPHQRVAFPIGAELVLHPRGAPLLLYVTDEMTKRREVMRGRRHIALAAPVEK